MTKITIISCIIAAVCIFQTAEAGIFDNSPLNGLLDGAKGKLEEGGKGMLDGIKGIGDKLREKEKEVLNGAKEAEKKVENGIKDRIDNVKNGIQKSKEQLQNGIACTKLYKEVPEFLTNIIQKFDSCFMNKTRSAKGDVEKLTNSISKLEKSLSKDIQNFTQCFQTNLMNPMNIISCISDISESFQQLGPQFEKIMFDAYQLIGIFPKVAECYEDVIGESGESLRNVATDAGKCIESFLNPLFK